MSNHLKQQWTDCQNVQVNKYMLLNINNVSHTIHILTTRSQRKIVIWDMFECVDHPWCVWIIHHVGHPQCESSTVWVIHTLCKCVDNPQCGLSTLFASVWITQICMIHTFHKCVDHSNMYDPHYLQVCGSCTLWMSVGWSRSCSSNGSSTCCLGMWIIHTMSKHVDHLYIIGSYESSSEYVSCLYYRLDNFVFQVSDWNCYTKVYVIITSNCTHEIRVRIR